MSSPKRLSERKLLFLIGAVQFVNILDFVMVMPLGPDLARELGVPTSQLGLVGGSYTAAAAVYVSASFVIDYLFRNIERALTVPPTGGLAGSFGRRRQRQINAVVERVQGVATGT